MRLTEQFSQNQPYSESSRDLSFLPLPYELRLAIVKHLSSLWFLSNKKCLERLYKPKIMQVSYEGDCLEWEWVQKNANSLNQYVVGSSYIICSYLSLSLNGGSTIAWDKQGDDWVRKSYNDLPSGNNMI